MIEQISLTDIMMFWQKLWPDRQEIPKMSWMTFEGGYAKPSDPIYYGWKIDGVLIGVNSIHKIGNTIRSRGLYVKDEHRGKNIGVSLLKYGVDFAEKQNVDRIWSYPKIQASTTYKKAGFCLITTNQQNNYAFIEF